MTKNDSFILYTRYESQLEMLTMEERGELLTAIFAWVRGGEYEIEKPAVKMAFSFISEQLEFDKGKYEKRCEKNRENIRENIRRRYERAKAAENDGDTLPNATNAYLSDSDSASASVSVSDSESVSASVSNEGEGSGEHISADAEISPAPARAKEKKDKNVRTGSGGTKKKYGSYKNVALTDGDLTVLRAAVPNFGIYIERMSRYIEASGKKYQNCCAALLGWYENDRSRGIDVTSKVSDAFSIAGVEASAENAEKIGCELYIPSGADSFDTDDFFGAALRKSYGAAKAVRASSDEAAGSDSSNAADGSVCKR